MTTIGLRYFREHTTDILAKVEAGQSFTVMKHARPVFIINPPAKPPRAVVFDVDGTLTQLMSWTDFTRQLGASVERHLEIYEQFKAGHITYEASREQLLKLWQATGRANYATIETIFAQWPLDPAARPLIEWLQARGMQVALITGSLDMYADITARRLGVTHVYANTKLVFAEDGALMSYDYVADQATKKLEQLQNFCSETGILPTDCLAVGDGLNDLALFKATGRGIMLDPDPRRAGLAELRAVSWKTVSTLAEVRPIIETVVV